MVQAKFGSASFSGSDEELRLLVRASGESGKTPEQLITGELSQRTVESGTTNNDLSTSKE